MKILHIEDNQSIIDSFSKILSKKGHNYIGVLDGRKGLELILKNDYDLIFLDLTMPNFSGFDLLIELRESCTSKKLNIVIVTAAHIPDINTESLYRDLVTDVLHKPISLKDLLNVVKKKELAVAG